MAGSSFCSLRTQNSKYWMAKFSPSLHGKSRVSLSVGSPTTFREITLQDELQNKEAGSLYSIYVFLLFSPLSNRSLLRYLTAEFSPLLQEEGQISLSVGPFEIKINLNSCMIPK